MLMLVPEAPHQNKTGHVTVWPLGIKNRWHQMHLSQKALAWLKWKRALVLILVKMPDFDACFKTLVFSGFLSLTGKANEKNSAMPWPLFRDWWILGCLVEWYLDDLIVYSVRWEGHIHTLEEVFNCLAAASLTIKAKLKATVTYLGRQVGQGQVVPLS